MKKNFIALLCAAALAPSSASAQIKFANQGVSDAEIRLGAPLDLSGVAKSWGASASNGLKMAVEEINARGGVHGRKIHLTIDDNGYDPKRSVMATSRLLSNEKVFAIVAPIGTAAVLAAQDLILESGVFQLFPFASSELVYGLSENKPQDRLKFGNIPPYADGVRGTLKYLIATKEPKNPCILYQDDAYGGSVLEGFTQQLKESNLQPAAITNYKRGVADVSQQVAQMKASNCDLVVLGTVVRETIAAMAEAKKIGWSPLFLGAFPSSGAEVPKNGKDIVEGLYAVGVYEMPNPETAKGKFAEWIKNYNNQFGAIPDTQAVAGYNAIQIIAFYAELAGKNLDGASFLNALESGVEFRDIFNTQPMKFSPTNHLGLNTSQLQQVQNGQWVLVKGGL